jgi:hypothetical protein
MGADAGKNAPSPAKASEKSPATRVKIVSAAASFVLAARSPAS